MTHQKPNLNNTIKVLVAYALVDRTDSYDLSPASSRTSKRSVDMAADSMDTLRVHGVIQQYLIERLVVKKDHHFWLQQTCEVFLRAYQDADSRMKKDNPRIGLPDDYRRFSLHGNKLLVHLSRYEKKVGGKQPLKAMLEEQVRQIDEERQRLQEAIQNKIISQTGEIPQLSVFDRANSLSESDSGTTSSQSHSQEPWTPAEDEMPDYVLSPVDFEPQPLPYPEEEDDNPTPHVTPRQDWDQAVSMPDERGFQAVVSVEERSRRQKSSSGLINKGDRHQATAEVMVSHETVETPRDFFVSAHRRSSAASSKGRPSPQSEAELSLAQITQKSTASPRGGGMLQDKGRSSSSGSGPRPKDLLSRGELNRARNSSGLSPGDNASPVEFSNGSGDKTCPPSALQRLRDSIMPTSRRRESSTSSHSRSSLQDVLPFARRKSSASSISRLSLRVPSSVRTSPGLEQNASMPPLPVAPDRSARSSPGQGAMPFYPPNLMGQRSLDFDLHRNIPPSFHQWPTTATLHHASRSNRIKSPEAGLNPTARPFQYLEHGRQQYGTGNLHSPGAWPPSVAGLTSVPMSRGSSHPGSNPAHQSRQRSSADSSRASVAGASRVGQQPRRYSSPPSSPVSSTLPHFSGPSLGASRPPSIVTEPSPRLSPRYDLMGKETAPQPPIPSRLQRGSGIVSRPRAFGSAPSESIESSTHLFFPPGPVASVPGAGATSANMAPRTAVATAPVRPQGLYKRTWSRFRAGRSRAQSADVRASRRQEPSAIASGDMRPEAVVGGEDMMRSGSGGIVVGQGRGRHIIEFGDVPVDLDAAEQRLRDRQARRERDQRQQQLQQQGQKGEQRQQAGVLSSGPARGSDGVGLGITSEDSRQHR